MMLINVYHGDQILNTSTNVGYDICAACTFSADETISIHDLKRHIYVGLKLLPSHFDISISALINTTLPGSGGFFYRFFGVFFEEIWEIIKTIVPYQILGYKTLELVVESESISSFDHYDLTNISESSNPVLAEERTHSRAQEQKKSCVPV
jgi:hypothetical protein